jgi:hypothetical protein
MFVNGKDGVSLVLVQWITKHAWKEHVMQALIQ